MLISFKGDIKCDITSCTSSCEDDTFRVRRQLAPRKIDSNLFMSIILDFYCTVLYRKHDPPMYDPNGAILDFQRRSDLLPSLLLCTAMSHGQLWGGVFFASPRPPEANHPIFSQEFIASPVHSHQSQLLPKLTFDIDNIMQSSKIFRRITIVVRK